MPPTVPLWIHSACVLLALSIVAPCPAIADWPTSSTVNLSVCTATDRQLGPQLTTDGSGGAIMTWNDTRAGSTNRDIFAQHVFANGVVDPAWAVNGQQVCAAIGNQQGPVISSDGNGGAVLAWQDFR